MERLLSTALLVPELAGHLLRPSLQLQNPETRWTNQNADTPPIR